MDREEDQRQPSAPVENEELSGEAPRVMPQPQVPYPSHPTVNYGSTSDPYQQPPPSYQDALNYPQIDRMPKPPMSPIYHETNVVSQPLQAPIPPPGHQAQVIHTIVATNVPGNCVWCRQGVIRNETDMCCLVCLVILAICTFPLGLVLLCCIPCTVRPRCSHCRRLQD